MMRTSTPVMSEMMPHRRAYFATFSMVRFSDGENS
jgi:hypothetical protein